MGSALTHYTAARQRQESVGNAEGLSRLDEKLGDLHRVLCQYHDALATFNQAQARTAEPARRATLWCKQAEIWRTLGEHARAADAYDAAEGEGGQNGAGLPVLTRAAIALGRGDLHSDMGAYGAADAAADRALHLLASAPPGPATDVLLMQAYHLQGNVAMRPWSLDRAEDRFTQLLPLAERRGDRHALAAAHMQLGRVMLSSPGKLDRAEDLIGRARRCFDEIGDQEGSARCWRGLGLVARLRRDWAAAEEAFRHSITIGEAIGYDRHVADLWGEMGILLLARGDPGGAAASYERALAIYTGQDVWEGLWGCGLALGRIALLRGNLACAEEHATRALAIARERGETRHRAGAWHVLAQVAYERGKLGAASCLGRLARRGAQAGSGELPRVLLTLARARLAGGRPEHAAILLAHAQDCVADSPSVYRLDIELDLTLARADLALDRAAVDEAEAMAPARALVRVAVGLREEALVTMLEGRCAHVAGRVADAEERLRAALASQTALGLALDAARTGVALAATLLAGSGSADASAEALLLLAQARTQFAASGALLDLAQAEQLAARWGIG